MNDTELRKLALASILVLAAIGAAAFSVWRSNRVPIPPTRPFLPVPAELSPDIALSAAAIDTIPTNENLPDVIDTVRSNVQSKLMALEELGFSREQIDDLTAAFTARLESVVSPDFDRDFAFAKSRGYLFSRDVAKQAYEKSRPQFHWMELSPLGSRRVEFLVQRGLRGETSEKLDGYMALTAWLRDEVSYPIDQTGAAIEVLIPVSCKTIPGISVDEREIVLLGLAFQWSEKRKQWIPGPLKSYSRARVDGLPDNKLTIVPSTF